jgi:hypothetical protein
MTCLKDLMKHLITGRLDDRSATPSTCNIDMALAINLNKYDKPSICHSLWVLILPIDTFLLYTDSSKLDNKQTRYGATTYKIIANSPTQIQSYSCNLGTRSEVFDAELHTIYEGLLLLPTIPYMQPTTTYLYINNHSMIQILSNHKHNDQFTHEALIQAQDLLHNS